VSCSAPNHELVKQYGADEAIDYTTINLPSYLSQNYAATRFDLVLDAVGSFELFYASPTFLKPRGEYILIAMDVPNSIGGFVAMFGNLVRTCLLPAFLGGVPRRFKLSFINVTEEAVQNVGRLIDQREIKPVLDSVWEFTDEGVKDAYRKLMTFHARGKVVIKVSD
jgi:NADPH:quinone reductase-like Zn-dependent oxidoreductase